VHGGADVEAQIARIRRQVPREEAPGEAAGAAAELDDAARRREIAVSDQQVERPVLVDRLQVLPAPEAVVEAPRRVI